MIKVRTSGTHHSWKQTCLWFLVSKQVKTDAVRTPGPGIAAVQKLLRRPEVTPHAAHPLSALSSPKTPLEAPRPAPPSRSLQFRPASSPVGSLGPAPPPTPYQEEGLSLTRAGRGRMRTGAPALLTGAHRRARRSHLPLSHCTGRQVPVGSDRGAPAPEIPVRHAAALASLRRRSRRVVRGQPGALPAPSLHSHWPTRAQPSSLSACAQPDAGGEGVGGGRRTPRGPQPRADSSAQVTRLSSPLPLPLRLLTHRPGGGSARSAESFGRRE